MGNKISLTNLALLTLEKSIDGVVRVNDLINHSYYYAYGAGWDKSLKKSDLSQALKRLRERGLIDFVSDEKLIFKLTDRGREKVILAKLLVDEKNWDGKYRIVIFDIPEKRRVTRDVLRSKLKAWGFTPWQQSVWVTKKNCAKELGSFIKSAGIGNWVKIFEADEIKF